MGTGVGNNSLTGTLDHTARRQKVPYLDAQAHHSFATALHERGNDPARVGRREEENSPGSTVDLHTDGAEPPKLSPPASEQSDGHISPGRRFQVPNCNPDAPNCSRRVIVLEPLPELAAASLLSGGPPPES